MSDEIKTDNSEAIKQQVDVLDSSGNVVNRSTSPLAGIFDKIAKGKEEGLSTEEILSKPTEPVVKETVTKTEAPKKEEVKADEPLKEVVKEEVKEPSRNKLFEDTEVKFPPKKEVVADKTTDGEVGEDELQVLPHDKPKTAKRIEALLKKIAATNADVAKTRQEAADKDAKLAELQKSLEGVKTVDPKVQEELTQREEELKMYRRRYALDNDPEIKTKFDGRIETSEKDIPEILKRNGAGDQLLKVINDEGGWLKFSRSVRPITLADGKQLSAAEFADTVINQLPFADRSKLQAIAMEQIQLQREKESFMKDEGGKASEYFKKLEEQNKNKQQQDQGQIQEVAKKIETWHKSVLEKNDWLKEKDIPAKATAEEKAELEKDNAYTKQLRSIFAQSLAPKNLEESMQIVEDSVKYYQERREKASLIKENAKLKAELEARNNEISTIKRSSKTTPKAGSLQGGGSISVGADKQVPRGLEAALDSLARGETLTNE